MPKMILELDQLDFDAIQKEIAFRQSRSRNIDPSGSTIIPDGESCLAGSLLAESIRDLNEYRSIFNADGMTAREKPE
jgi:hypothetical protein